MCEEGDKKAFMEEVRFMVYSVTAVSSLWGLGHAALARNNTLNSVTRISS